MDQLSPESKVLEVDYIYRGENHWSLPWKLPTKDPNILIFPVVYFIKANIDNFATTHMILVVTYCCFKHSCVCKHICAQECSQAYKTFFKKCLFIFERERASRGGAESEGDTEPEAGSRLRAVSTEPHAGLQPISSEIMT